jgi:N-acetylglucosaminyldiphosphoundecaprenol N-acetyl-beta-D-mannosaminyltransferase
LTGSRENVHRASFLGCVFDRVEMKEAVERCRDVIEARGFAQHMSVNAAKLIAMRDDPRLRALVRDCELITADGQSVVWASRLIGDPLPARVAGIDLMHQLLKLAEERRYRVFILGARREVLEAAVKRLRDLHPALPIAGYRDGYFSESEEDAVAAEIRRADADILFVAMSSPRKEYWLGRYGPVLGVPLVMGVGGAIDVVAGVTRRAPVFLRHIGLEWLFRLLQEPGRLFRRYLTTNALFLVLLGKELVSTRALARYRVRGDH